MTTNGNGSEPVGYGHDRKGAAMGEAKNEGRPTVAHQPADGADGGKMIKFTLDGQEVETPEGETIFRTARRRAIGRTAIAASAWWRSRASACSPRAVSAPPRRA